MDSVEMELQNYYTRQRAGEAQDAGLVEPAPPTPPTPSSLEQLGSFAESLGLDLKPGVVETLLTEHGPKLGIASPSEVAPMDLIKGLDAVLKIIGVPFKATGLASQKVFRYTLAPLLQATGDTPENIQKAEDAIRTVSEFATPFLYSALGKAAPHVARQFNRLMVEKGEVGALDLFGAGEGIRGFLGPGGEHYLAGREGHRFADVAKDIREKGVRYRMVEEPGRGIPTRLAVDIRKPLTDAERSEILKMSRDAEQTVVDYPGGAGEAHTLDDVRRLLQETDSFFGNARTSALANEISGVHAQAGGSTFNLTTGKNLVGQEGYAVSTFKGHEKILDHAPTAQDIEQYLSSLPAEIRSNPNLSLGTWESGGKHYLDVSQVEPDLNKALALGQQHQQQAVFDLKNLKDVPVADISSNPFRGDLPQMGQGLAKGIITNTGKRVEIPYGSQTHAGLQNQHQELSGIRYTIAENRLDVEVLTGASSGSLAEAKRLIQAEGKGRTIVIDSPSNSPSGPFLDSNSFTTPGAALRFLEKIPIGPEVGSESVGAAASKLAPGGTVEMNRALARTAGQLPTLQKAVDFFHAGQFNRDWYKGVAEELQKNFGDQADMMARLIAVTSPFSDPKDNVNLALKIFKQVVGKDTSKWTDAKWEKVTNEAGVIYRTFAPNIRRAVEGGELGGLKVQNFYRALQGDPNAVVVDRWMARFYLGEKGTGQARAGLSDSMYALIRGKILSGSNALGVPPSEFQAAIWAAQKMITEGKSAADFPKMADTIRQGVAEAEKRGLIPAKTSAAMKTTMGLAVAIALGQTDGS